MMLDILSRWMLNVVGLAKIIWPQVWASLGYFGAIQEEHLMASRLEKTI